MYKILVIMAALLASQQVLANNWYVGAGLGVGHAKDASNNAASGNSTVAQYGISNITSINDNSGTLSIFGGYRFNKQLAAELAYSYLGYYDMHGFTGPGNTLPAGSEENRADAISLAAVLTVPIGSSLSLYGKLGPTLTTNEQTTCISNVWWCDNSSDVKTGMMIGAGASVSLPRLIGNLRLEIDSFNHVGNGGSEFTSGRFTQLQLQYVYSFPGQ